MRDNLRAGSPTGAVPAWFCHHCLGIKLRSTSGSSLSPTVISTSITTHCGSRCHFSANTSTWTRVNTQWSQRDIYLLTDRIAKKHSTLKHDIMHTSMQLITLVINTAWSKAHSLVFFIHSQTPWKKWLQMSLKLCTTESIFSVTTTGANLNSC